MDIFASGQDAPIRIDLFDDEIDTLKFLIQKRKEQQLLKKFYRLTCERVPIKRRTFNF
jgi:transcription-repair coupling factor (superfamily II helicase)